MAMRRQQARAPVVAQSGRVPLGRLMPPSMPSTRAAINDTLYGQLWTWSAMEADLKPPQRRLGLLAYVLLRFGAA